MIDVIHQNGSSMRIICIQRFHLVQTISKYFCTSSRCVYVLLSVLAVHCERSFQIVDVELSVLCVYWIVYHIWSFSVHSVVLMMFFHAVGFRFWYDPIVFQFFFFFLPAPFLRFRFLVFLVFLPFWGKFFTYRRYLFGDFVIGIVMLTNNCRKGLFCEVFDGFFTGL